MKINSIYKTIKDNSIVNFRSPEAGDGELLLAYFKKLFGQSSRFLNYSNKHYLNQSPIAQESFIQKFSEDKHSFAIFANIDDSVIGNIVVDNKGSERTQHRATLMMGVLEEWQNNGIGQILLSLAIEEASKIGILSLELHVRDYNPIAIKLYENNGFVKIGAIQGAAKIDGAFVNDYILIRNSYELMSQLSPMVDRNANIEENDK
jgi:RimJ/RimL family protein N-acetyltransferase